MAAVGRSSGRVVARALRLWLGIIAAPTRSFATRVAPGEQAPGLAFAMAVVLLEEASRLVLVPGALPAITGHRATSAVLTLGFVALVTPVLLHLLAALQTLLLMAVVERRSGVSETVQLIAFATAPCVLAGIPIPALRLGVCLYGFGVLLLGLQVVHGASRWQAFLAGTIPGALLFGYGFRGFAAAGALL